MGSLPDWRRMRVASAYNEHFVSRLQMKGRGYSRIRVESWAS